MDVLLAPTFAETIGFVDDQNDDKGKGNEVMNKKQREVIAAKIKIFDYTVKSSRKRQQCISREGTLVDKRGRRLVFRSQLALQFGVSKCFHGCNITFD